MISSEDSNKVREWMQEYAVLAGESGVMCDRRTDKTGSFAVRICEMKK